MKKLLFIFLLICLFCTCKKDSYANLCGGKDPIKNLSWLKPRIDEYQKNNDQRSGLIRVVRGEYKGQTLYFFVLGCCAACSCNSAGCVYDCEGNTINFTSNQFIEILYDSSFSQNDQVIWNK